MIDDLQLGRRRLGRPPHPGRATTTPPVAAQLLGIDVRTVRARIERGEIAGGAVRTNQRLRWFVYTDALTHVDDTLSAQPPNGPTHAQLAAATRANQLLLQAYSELQSALERSEEGRAHLTTGRTIMAENDEAVLTSASYLQQALTLLDTESTAVPPTATGRRHPVRLSDPQTEGSPQ